MTISIQEIQSFKKPHKHQAGPDEHVLLSSSLSFTKYSMRTPEVAEHLRECSPGLRTRITHDKRSFLLEKVFYREVGSRSRSFLVEMQLVLEGLGSSSATSAILGCALQEHFGASDAQLHR